MMNTQDPAPKKSTTDANMGNDTNNAKDDFFKQLDELNQFDTTDKQNPDDNDITDELDEILKNLTSVADSLDQPTLANNTDDHLNDDVIHLGSNDITDKNPAIDDAFAIDFTNEHSLFADNTDNDNMTDNANTTDHDKAQLNNDKITEQLTTSHPLDQVKLNATVNEPNANKPSQDKQDLHRNKLDEINHDTVHQDNPKTEINNTSAHTDTQNPNRDGADIPPTVPIAPPNTPTSPITPEQNKPTSFAPKKGVKSKKPNKNTKSLNFIVLSAVIALLLLIAVWFIFNQVTQTDDFADSTQSTTSTPAMSATETPMDTQDDGASMQETANLDISSDVTSDVANESNASNITPPINDTLPNAEEILNAAIPQEKALIKEEIDRLKDKNNQLTEQAQLIDEQLATLNQLTAAKEEHIKLLETQIEQLEAKKSAN